MGAKVGQPDRAVWCIDGDGCFQMTNQELATCVINNIPIKVAVINNSSLVVEEVLPLPDHAQRTVVDDRDPARDVVDVAGSELLLGQLEAPGAVRAPH